MKGDPAGWLRTHCRPTDVVLDVGANRGSATELLQPVVRWVYAVEPNPWHTEPMLRQHWPNVIVFQVAAGARHQEGVPFTIATKSDESSLLEEAVLGAKEREIVVNIEALDDIVPERVDAVKIDAQGGDGAILDGMDRLLSTVRLLVVEVWPFGLRQFHHGADRIHATLTRHGLFPKLADGTPVTAQYAEAYQARDGQSEHTNWYCDRDHP
jgi:FkbM family methyltransferase